MVCLGNICRSPMAEGLMRAVLLEKGIAAEIDSAGTSGHHRGEAPDRRAIRCMQGHGIDISMLRARQFVADDFSRFDHIFVMDLANQRDIMRMPGARQHPSLRLMLSGTHGHDAEVPDPWYGGQEGFEDVFLMLKEACEHWAAEINKPR
ncbi:MAG: low molecular weight phosphotyrosine protein phosphatase, partial [Flavobacteriales bacterium]|nr:low molecular weight phosphotyrosine protein phosphatase [Flavobacteriales bacterium]